LGTGFERDYRKTGNTAAPGANFCERGRKANRLNNAWGTIKALVVIVETDQAFVVRSVVVRDFLDLESTPAATDQISGKRPDLGPSAKKTLPVGTAVRHALEVNEIQPAVRL
jgi:hypothetical protein